MSAHQYVCTTSTKARKLNQQNLHIAKRFDQCNGALVNLMQMGITVLRVVIEGASPSIHVIEAKACSQLNSHVCITAGEGDGQRSYIRRAILNGCQIEWKTYEAH